MTDNNEKAAGREAAEAVMLLPWYAAGTLSPEDRARVDSVLRQYPELGGQLTSIREDLAETVHLNEAQSVPSTKLADRLMAAIDAESPPVPAAPLARETAGNWLTRFFAGLSPRMLAAGASVAVVVIGLQSVMLAEIATRSQPSAEYRGIESSGQQIGTFAMVRFARQASAADVTELLQSYRAEVVGGPTLDGIYRVRLAAAPLSRDDLGRLLHRFRQESIVQSAEPAAPGQ